MVIAFVLIPLFYRLKVVSLYEYLDGRFGMTTHLTGAWFLVQGALVGLQRHQVDPCGRLKAYGTVFEDDFGLLRTFVGLHAEGGAQQDVYKRQPGGSPRPRVP